MRSTPKASLSVKKNCGGIRSDSNCWNAAIGCPTIWHETLHRLGLFDEYVEQNGDGAVHDAQNNLVKAGDNCRAIGPSNSIMNQPTSAIQDLYPTYSITTLTCPEGATDAVKAECTQILDRMEQGGPVIAPIITHRDRILIGVQGAVAKPIGYADPEVAADHDKTMAQVLYPYQLSGADDLKGLDPEDVVDYGEARVNGKRVSSLRYEFAIKNPPLKSVVLAPAEFTAVLFPTCGINNLFYTCGHFAYSSGSCGNRPAACTEGSSWTNLPANQIP